MQDEVEVKARELLANAPVTRFIGHDFVPKEAAVRAIAAAIRQRPVVDDARMARALEWVRGYAFGGDHLAQEHLPAIEEAIAAYDPNCGGRTVRVVDDAMVERACRSMAGQHGKEGRGARRVFRARKHDALGL